MSTEIRPIKVKGVIGHGSFGYVFACEDENGTKVAWKRMLKIGKTLSREMEILELLKGKSRIVKLLYFFYSLNYKNELIQNFVFDFYPTNLEEILKLHQRNAISLAYADIKRIVYQILLGVSEMHKLGICHRDLKPENILVKGPNLYIADLGSAKKLLRKNTPYVVSRYYRAPELILGIDSYNLSIDLWAIGVIFFEFLFKKLPFRGKTEGQQLIEIYGALGTPALTDQEFLRGFMCSFPAEIDFVFQLEQKRDIWDEIKMLKVDEHERMMVSNWLRECWSYRFDQRPEVSEAAQRSLWRDVWDNFEISTLKREGL